MFTTARADDDDAPGLFFMDVRAARAAGGSEVAVTAEWDGAGMTATQSHAARLERMPATRLAWAGEIDVLVANAAPFITMAFTAVVLGVFDVAMQFAREQLGRSATRCVPSNRSSGPAPISSTGPRCRRTKVALRTIETSDPRAGLHAGLRAKTAVAEAAEARAAPPHPGARRRHVLAPLADLGLVRGRPRPRVPPPAVGPGVRRPLRDLVRQLMGDSGMTICISADSHVTEPPDTYVDRIDPAYRDRAPRLSTTTRSAT